MYALSGTITTTRTDDRGTKWSATSQIPTFFLSERVQGIVDIDHAQRVAVDVIDPTQTLRRAGAVIALCAVPAD